MLPMIFRLKAWYAMSVKGTACRFTWSSLGCTRSESTMTMPVGSSWSMYMSWADWDMATSTSISSSSSSNISPSSTITSDLQ